MRRAGDPRWDGDCATDGDLPENEVRPFENELVRLRAQIATLEERNVDLEEGRDNFESVYAGFEKQLARKDAKLEAEEKEQADLEATLEKAKADLEATLEKENADLEAEILELKLEHKLDYKKLDDRKNQEIEEGVQQDIRSHNRPWASNRTPEG